MKEIWKSIAGYEGLYEVSSLTRVRSLDRNVKCKNGSHRFKKGRVLKYGISPQGYKMVVLCYNGQKSLLVHKLFAVAFIPNPENHKYINHENGIKTDNRIENLKWCTKSYDVRHALRTGLIKPRKGFTGSKHPSSKPVYCYDLEWNFIKEYPSQHCPQREGVAKQGNIQKVLTGKISQTGGYKWSRTKF